MEKKTVLKATPAVYSACGSEPFTCWFAFHTMDDIAANIGLKECFDVQDTWIPCCVVFSFDF